MNHFEKNLEKYAELIVKSGINIQKGQTLVVRGPIQAAYFVRKVAQSAYDAGAKDVHVEYSDEILSLIKYKNAPDEAFMQYPQWKADGFAQMAKEDHAFLSIHGANPDLLKEV